MLPFDPEKPFVWLEDSLGPGRGGPSWLFTGLQAVETAADNDVTAALARLRAASSDHWIAGWLAYEAGYLMEARLTPLARPSGPLMWFGAFAERHGFDPLAVESLWKHPVTTPVPFARLSLTPRDLDEATYAEAIERILAYISAGDVYQINFTYPADGQIALHPLHLYRLLRESQRVPYGALIHDGAGNWTLSFSPELFFRIDKRLITAKPMKGTAKRLPIPADDQNAAKALQADEKNRAENLMIVDLLRNDISRIAETGSVEVPKLYEIETLATLHSMTSTIRARLADGKDAFDALAALFPCGSVTGAPKIRAMEIIRELESHPRGIYCGAIGWIGPSGDAAFNVPIRTLSIAGNTARLGLGSGIVADSLAADEWRECQLKGQFLSRGIPPFDLFETLVWRPEYGYWQLEQHLQRLAASADYWGFPCDIAAWQKSLTDHAAPFLHAALSPARRVRFLLSRSGNTICQSSPLPLSPAQPVTLAISPNRMNSSNPFLYHKTTHRSFYDDERQRLAKATGCFDCLFLNERDEVTEGSFTTLFIRKNGKLLTPALACGLLPGIQRHLLIAHEGCTEAILTLEDVRQADAILIGNSVRGLLGAKLIENQIR